MRPLEEGASQDFSQLAAHNVNVKTNRNSSLKAFHPSAVTMSGGWNTIESDAGVL